MTSECESPGGYQYKKENMSNLATTTISILFILLATYPTSPVLFAFFSIDPQATFVALSICTIIILKFSDSNQLCLYGRWRKALLIITIFGSLVLIFKIMSHGTTIAYRDLLILTITYFISKIKTVKIFKIIKFSHSILLQIIIISGVVILLSYHLKFIDFLAWNALNLEYIHPANPAITRTDNDFYLPLLLAVIPFDQHGAVEPFAFGLEYQRQPIIFTEWTYTWYFLTPMLILYIANKHTQFRNAKITILLLALGVSFSVWGFFVLIFTGLCCLTLKKENTVNLIFLAIIVICLAVMLATSLDRALAIVGGNKLEQFLYYADKIDISKMLTPLGHPNSYEGADDYTTWGSLFVATQYGLTGLTFRLAVFTGGIIGALYVIYNRNNFSLDTYGIAASTLYLSLMGIKTPYLAPYYELTFIWLLFLLIDEQSSRGPPINAKNKYQRTISSTCVPILGGDVGTK